MHSTRRMSASRDHPHPSALRSLPNLLSVLRLASVPVLWGVALLGEPVVLGMGWAAAGATDLVDGWLARRSHQTSALGSTLDSVADHLLSASGLAWLLIFRADFFREQWLPLLLWTALALATLIASWLKFRRAVDLHLYSAKLAGFAGTLFGISLLVLGSYRPAVFYAVIAACFLATAEALAVVLTRDGVDERIGTILRSASARR